MPKLYEYMGLIIFFYSNEHEPIHVHAQYGDMEGKIEIVVVNGQAKKLRYKSVKNKKKLKKKHQKYFMEIANLLADEIIQSWINYFVLHKKIITKKINGKL